MEQSTSDSRILSLSQFLQAKASCMDCDRKILEGETDEVGVGVGLIGMPIAAIGHLRPSFYIHSVRPSS